MGINVSIYRELPNGRVEEHPEWDWLRAVGDNLLPAMMKVGKQIGDPSNFEFWYRPVDPLEMSARMTELYPCNKERWEQLAEILSDPDWWAYFSI